MNPNLKAATATVATVAALWALIAAPVAFASPSEWDDQNSDKTWNTSSPVVAPATDPVETDPTPASVSDASTQTSSAPSPVAQSVPAAANQPSAASSAPVAADAKDTSSAPVAAVQPSAEPAVVSASQAPVAVASPAPSSVSADTVTQPVPSHITTISKAPEDSANLASKSPYIHSQPKMVAPFPLLLNRSVQNYVADFLDQPAGLKVAFQRSRPFMRDMLNVLKQQGLPDDLVYLTFAESGFSKKGKGPWQFTADTAARFGLRVNKWLDERRDPILSTKAAAEYLAELHDQADNDWRVALIGWNTGEGNLERYWLLQGANYTKFADRLPRRTRQLLNRFMAVAFIAHNAASYGLADVKYTEPPSWTMHSFKGGTLLSSIAKKFETTVAKLRDLNPALRADRVPPNERTYAVRVPRDDED